MGEPASGREPPPAGRPAPLNAPLPASGPCCVLVTAAGSGVRFGGKKELEKIGDRTVLESAVEPFLGLDRLAGVVVTVPAGTEAEVRSSLSAGLFERLAALEPLGLAFTAGGASRQESVLNGLEALASGAAARGLDPDSMVVLVHDGARPWASAGLARRVEAAARTFGACLPLAPLTDTPKAVAPRAPTATATTAAAETASDGHGDNGAPFAPHAPGAAPPSPAAIPDRAPDTASDGIPANEGTTGVPPIDGFVAGHPDRDRMAGAQTPQGFILGCLLAAHRKAAAERAEFTDDTALWDRYVGRVAWVRGDPENRKVTYRADLPAPAPATPGTGAQPGSPAQGALHIGSGWDSHRLVQGRRLLLAGVELASDRGEDGHSDGDVLWHAVIDALLGAAGLGDIGTHFPPSEPRWKDADSSRLAAHAMSLVHAAGWNPVNLDCTVLLERPRVGPFRDAIRANLASVLGMEPGNVSVKAKTREGMDSVGQGLAIEAQAAVLLRKA